MVAGTVSPRGSACTKAAANWWRRSEGRCDRHHRLLDPDDAAPDLATHPLYEEAPAAVAGRQHPLATRRSCTPQMLASYPWDHRAGRTRRCVPNGSASSLIAAPRRRWSAIMIIGRLLTASDLLTLAMPDQVARQVRTGLLSCIGAPLAEAGRRSARRCARAGASRGPSSGSSNCRSLPPLASAPTRAGSRSSSPTGPEGRCHHCGPAEFRFSIPRRPFESRAGRHCLESGESMFGSTTHPKRPC